MTILLLSQIKSFLHGPLAAFCYCGDDVRPWYKRLIFLALLWSGLSGLSGVAVAQSNRFVTRNDFNQVQKNTAKSGNVILNDSNPDNLPNAAFIVTLGTSPVNGTLTSINPDGSYVYTPNPGYLGSDSFTYSICQPGAFPACSNTSTVTLNVYDPTVVCTLGTGQNLLNNPSFTQGNTGFSTSYDFVATPSSVPSLYQEGTYAIGTNSTTYHNNFIGTGRTGPTDKFMMVNGAARLEGVYSQTITVLPNRYYSFSAYAASLNNGIPAQLGLVVDGKSTSVVTTLPTTPGQYVQFSDLYFSGPGPASGFPITIEIRDVNKVAVGNDFGLDDVYFGSCSAFLLADTKTTTPVPDIAVPAAILPLSATINVGGSVGVTVASFVVQSLPASGVLRYNGVPVTENQVIPVASVGSLSSGGSLTYTPVGGCTGTTTTFTYTALDSDGTGSENIATYTIPVTPIATPTIRMAATGPVCPGTQVPLRAGSRPGFLFTWYNGATIVNGAGSVLNDSVFVASAAGTYTVKIQWANCSTTSNGVNLTVLPPLTAGTVGTNQTVCADVAPALLSSTAGAGGGTGNYSYQWESSGNNTTWSAIAGATGADYAPGILAATTYFRRQVTSGTGSCATAYANTVVVNVLPAVTPGSIGGNQTICAASVPAAFTSTAGAGGGTGSCLYQWESSVDNITWNPIAGATAATYAPGPLTTTTHFRRQATSTAGTCQAAVSNPVIVRVQAPLTVGVALAAPPAQCAGTALTFTPTLTNAGSTPTYSWFVNNAPVASTPTYTSSTLANGDQVRVEITPTVGFCATGTAAATATVVLTPSLLPTLTIESQQEMPVCPGTSLTFLVAQSMNTGTAPQYQWQVDGADVAGATGATFTSSTLRDGQQVTLKLRTTTNCNQPAAAASNSVKVTISQLAKVNAGPDKEIEEGQEVVLQGSIDGNYPVTWSPAQGLTFVNGNRLQPIAAPTTTTTYTLSAGPSGCQNVSQVTVKVKKRPLIRIPNAFSPNGDGQDDTWEIDRIGDFTGNAVTVFNRWGNQVFKTTNYSRTNEWNGQINGQPAPLGTYYYVITLGKGQTYSGSLTVVY
ncbi:gliding motility-associated C-terminal domain-containing protein [Hymenobacter sp. BT186]|uniref:Gliding motility-associated C-terminal domain-containing protein n=1 Tax=Hymenobacter telluris TaxID=2816474 RepID=A0A939JD96_9BACT|nr:gliding motility-associated C-terminal domain-containing protein [Hymenobacter telluris]MBO0358122.1 gliding motility-associated C-terminal domain-containing protein [Hymenobacter telluris]MBW3374149.1 gliding motility-associated C-terminal domain-containing protein [Hymenobacter norwichensis]